MACGFISIKIDYSDYPKSLMSIINKRGSYMVWEINMGVCPRLEFDSIIFMNCL